MSDKILKVANQVFRLVYVIRNVAYHRSLHEYKDKFEQNYWILIFNNFLDIAVLEWCKVFGSNKDETHWSNHIKDKEEFRKQLLYRLNLSQEEWNKYWNSMKSYRDHVVAHHEHDPNITSYPDLNHALISCYFYYEIIIKELRLLKSYDYPDNLEDYFQDTLSKANIFSKTAYSSTLLIEDE